MDRKVECGTITYVGTVVGAAVAQDGGARLACRHDQIVEGADEINCTASGWVDDLGTCIHCERRDGDSHVLVCERDVTTANGHVTYATLNGTLLDNSTAYVICDEVRAFCVG